MEVTLFEEQITESDYRQDEVVNDSNVMEIMNWIPVNSSINDQEKTNSTPLTIEQYQNDILNIIMSDTFEDGILTQSEMYIKKVLSNENCEYIKTALMNLYVNNLSNPHLLTGLLLMISCIPYNKAIPQCPIMALGLLQNNDIYIRDSAIQVFEKWNSKKGISILKSLKCDQKWLQRYVDRVIMYLEKEGTD